MIAEYDQPGDVLRALAVGLETSFFGSIHLLDVFTGLTLLLTALGEFYEMTIGIILAQDLGGLHNF